jgi:hypothetical protein
MGFDLIGVNPKLKDNPPQNSSREEYEEFLRENVGYYFRANGWYWRPIWNIVTLFCYPSILNNEDVEGGFYNDGYVINEEKALAIAECLEEKILTGELINVIEEENEYSHKLPNECCNICEGTGVRKNEIIEEPLFDREPYLLDENQPEGTLVECNKCEGTGQIRPVETFYTYSLSCINDFIKFCKNCGGFSIA